MSTGITDRRTARPPDTITARRARIRDVARRREDWLQLVPFCLIGALGAVVNMAVYVGGLRVADVAPLLAATVAFCVAVGHNYLANRWVTFRRARGDFMAQASRFAVVSTVALAVNLVLLMLLLDVMRSIPAQALAICLVTPVNFLGNKLWTFAGAGS